MVVSIHPEWINMMLEKFYSCLTEIARPWKRLPVPGNHSKLTYICFQNGQDCIANLLKWEIFTSNLSWFGAVESKIEWPFQGYLLISKKEHVLKSSLKQLYNEPREQIVSRTYMKRQEELKHANSFDKQFFSFFWICLKFLALLCMKGLVNYFIPSISLSIPYVCRHLSWPRCEC